MFQIVALHFLKIGGAMVVAAIYDWALMMRLWTMLTLEEYKSSLRRWRWLSILGIALDFEVALEIAPLRDPVSLALKIALSLMLLPILAHGLLAFRSIDLTSNNEKIKK